MPSLSDALARLAEIATRERHLQVQSAATALVAEHLRAPVVAVLRVRDGRVDVRGVHGVPDEVCHHPIPASQLGSLDTIIATDLITELTGRDRDHLMDHLGLPEQSEVLVAGMHLEGRPYGAILASRPQGAWSREEVRDLGAIAKVFALGLLKVRLAWRLWRQDQLLADAVGRASGPTAGAEALLDRSRAPDMRNAILLARQAAQSDTPILLTGETGVGKEVMARAIHRWSGRSGGPFVAVNCAALPHGLRESELFGHAAGAFSGATGTRAGRFQAADGGTLLLDEIGELDAGAQAMLLRVLQEKAFEPVGSDRTIRVDVRIVAATNRDLEAEVDAGRFRRDLWYRLSVFPLHIPPLRDRIEDIPIIAADWLERRSIATGRGPWTLSPAALQRLRAYRWPGNVRELLNALERATILQPAGGFPPDYFPALTLASPSSIPAPPAASGTLAAQEDAAIRAALVRCRGRIYGSLGAAAELGLKPSTLQSRMRKRGIPRVPPDDAGPRSQAP